MILAEEFTTGIGSTMTRNVSISSSQSAIEVNTGVTIIIAVSGVELVLVATKEGILPTPLAGIPIEGKLLVQ